MGSGLVQTGGGGWVGSCLHARSASEEPGTTETDAAGHPPYQQAPSGPQQRRHRLETREEVASDQPGPSPSRVAPLGERGGGTRRELGPPVGEQGVVRVGIIGPSSCRGAGHCRAWQGWRVLGWGSGRDVDVEG